MAASGTKAGGMVQKELRKELLPPLVQNKLRKELLPPLVQKTTEERAMAASGTKKQLRKELLPPLVHFLLQ